MAAKEENVTAKPLFIDKLNNHLDGIMPRCMNGRRHHYGEAEDALPEPGDGYCSISMSALIYFGKQEPGMLLLPYEADITVR